MGQRVGRPSDPSWNLEGIRGFGFDSVARKLVFDQRDLIQHNLIQPKLFLSCFIKVIVFKLTLVNLTFPLLVLWVIKVILVNLTFPLPALWVIKVILFNLTLVNLTFSFPALWVIKVILFSLTLNNLTSPPSWFESDVLSFRTFPNPTTGLVTLSEFVTHLLFLMMARPTCNMFSYSACYEPGQGRHLDHSQSRKGNKLDWLRLGWIRSPWSLTKQEGG